MGGRPREIPHPPVEIRGATEQRADWVGWRGWFGGVVKRNTEKKFIKFRTIGRWVAGVDGWGGWVVGGGGGGEIFSPSAPVSLSGGAWAPAALAC